MRRSGVVAPGAQRPFSAAHCRGHRHARASTRGARSRASAAGGGRLNVDFRFTPEQERFRREIRRFLDAHVSEALREEIATCAYTPGPLAKDFLRLLGEQGWLGVGWPKEYGGQGKTMIEQMIFYDELDLRDIHYGGLTITSLAMTLMKLASEEQKQQYLPRILRGELEICLGYTEPGAGSDLASLITRAERDGEDYVITGQKVFTTGAHYCTHIWLLART